MAIKSDKVKQSFQTFCDGTSMHGFTELYYAKNAFWTVFWVILAFSAIGLTTYQVIRAINQFMDQEPNTRIEQVFPVDLYPPIKICSMHWVYWLDWEKALSLNFTKESILYGLSYLTKIYSSAAYDIERAKSHFQATMALNNFTKLQQFYKSVAKDLTYFTLERTLEQLNAFQEKEMFFSTYWSSAHMCYIASSEIVLKGLNDDREVIQLFLFLEIKKFSNLSDHLTSDEYNMYLAEWFSTTIGNYLDNDKSQVKNFSGFILPLLFFPDAFSQNFLPVKEDNDLYTIGLSAQVNRFLSNPANKCLADQRMISSNMSFCEVCNRAPLLPVTQCQIFGKAIMSNSDDPETVCRNQIVQTSMSSNIEKELSPKNKLDIYKETERYSVEKKTCIQKCIFPCELWIYDFAYDVQKYSTEAIRNFLTQTNTMVQIFYPDRVLKMVQVESQTWEDFVANIGGLLGVWTGASMLSLIQLFYLCCFSGMNLNCSIFKGKKEPSTSTLFEKSGELQKNMK